jgi:iron complex transport system substrate-binding protein
MRHDDQITETILREAIAIHRDLGPRLFEATYELLLADALQAAGLRVERQVSVPIQFRGRDIKEAYRLDLLVERLVVVECKSVEKLSTVHSQQLLTYLRLGGFPIGLLLNFGEGRLVDGVKRLVNNYQPPPESALRLNRPLSA